MAQRSGRSLAIVALTAVLMVLGSGGRAGAQDKPRAGGELIFVVAAEPPGFDGHREETFAMLHPIGPHYSTLMRVDPTDKTGTKFIGDLAESWTASPDKRTYTFKLRQGVKFHDGAVMTSKDVKASYDKIVFPPAGIVSSRREQYKAVEAVEAPTPDTVVFRLKYPEASFIASVSSPWNWIYRAEILAKDPHWHEKNINGTGPFKFVEYVRGSHWVGKKNSDYWDKGKPYLDGYRAVFIQDAGAQVAAIRGERAMVQFRGFSPQQRDQLTQALGSKITVQESPWNCSIQVAMNQQKKPFDDKRVRRALTLALDRWGGSKALSRIAVVKDVAGIQVPGTPWATPPEELMKLAGYGTDVNAARAEARRLLKEAGAENLSFTLTNRAVPMPYEPVGIWLIDQWRQIGVNVKQVVPGVGGVAAGAEVRRVRGVDQCPVQLDRRARHGSALVPHDVAGQLQPPQGHGDGRALSEAGPRHRPGGAEEVPARVREAPLRRGGALHPRTSVEPDRAAHDEGAGLDDHAEPLPELPARRSLAQRVARASPTR